LNFSQSFYHNHYVVKCTKLHHNRTIFTARCYAQRGIATASCRPSVRNVEVSWIVITCVGILQQQFNGLLARIIRSLQTPTLRIYSKGNTRHFGLNRGRYRKSGFRRKSWNISEMRQCSTKVTIEDY